MSVVNCRVANIRPKYKDLSDWIADEKNIYVGRRGVVFVNGARYPPVASNFANPFKIGKDGTREEVLKKYESYITKKLEEDPVLLLELKTLKGKNLGCWCHPDPCHGDILLKLLKMHD